MGPKNLDIEHFPFQVARLDQFAQVDLAELARGDALAAKPVNGKDEWNPKIFLDESAGKDAVPVVNMDYFRLAAFTFDHQVNQARQSLGEVDHLLNKIRAGVINRRAVQDFIAQQEDPHPAASGLVDADRVKPVPDCNPEIGIFL